MILLLIHFGGKISACVDFRKKVKNYSIQVFKTMQGVHGWIRPFHIVFTAYCCRIFVPAGAVFYITFHLLNDQGFKVFQVSATEYSKCTVVLLFRCNLIFVYP